MNGHAALAAAFAAEGVDVLFGVLGDGNMDAVLDMVETHGIRFVAARHEHAALAMADGYARATGRPGVCTVTHGPGLTQVATALVTARRAGSPVVVLAGDTAAAARLHAQNLDQSAFAEVTAGAHQAVRTPATLAEDVRLAFRHVRLGRGPIVLSAALDVQFAPMPPDWTYVASSRTLPPPQRRVPDPDRVAAVAQRLTASRRAVLLAGRGAIGAGAHAEIVALAERTGALLATTLLAKGWFRGHPRDVGIAGGFAVPEVRQLLGQADCVVAFGASLNRFTTDHGKLFTGADVIQIDADPLAIGDPATVDDAVLGDARLVAAALLAHVPSATSGWPTQLPTSALPAPPATSSGPLDPRTALRLCDQLLPRPRAVVVGVGHYSGWAALHLGCDDPANLHLPWEFGAVGVALGVAVGVAVARPDLTVVVAEGDGGLMMSLPELETAARCGIPLVVLVVDDGAYGAELHQLTARGRSGALTLFDNPGFVDVARSLGLAGHLGSTPDELSAALARVRADSGPALVHVPVSRAVVHEEIFAALRA